MRILLDGRILGPKITGVERHILELLSQFERESIRGNHDISVYIRDGSELRYQGIKSHREDASRVPIQGFDVYHRPFTPSDFSSIVELVSARSSVLTLHDLIAYSLPGYWESKEEYQSYRRHVEFAAVAVDRVIAISQANKTELLNTLPISESKIDVIPLGVSGQFRVTEDQRIKADFLQRYGLQTGYLLSLGTDYPHKNRIGLLKAFELLIQDFPSARLVLAGPVSGMNRQPEVEGILRRLSSRVIDLGALPDDDLVELYNNALAFVFPSLYEGFGMPLLEAFACGVPSLCSNRSALPEIAGDAALLVDTARIDEFYQGLKTIYEKENLRRELTAKGLVRAAQFTWERTAVKTLRTYMRAIESRGQGCARQDRRKRGVRQECETPEASEPASEARPVESFTLAICTRNRAERLKEALSSVAKLSLNGISEFELLVIDNGSNDETARVVEEASSNMKFPFKCVVEKEVGLSRARNRAIREARGEVIIFVDDDEELPEAFIIEYAKAYSRWPQALCIGAKVELKWSQPRPHWLTDNLLWVLGKTVCKDDERRYRAPEFCFGGGNFSFRREVFERVGVFNPELGYRGRSLYGNEDIEMLKRIDGIGGVIVYSPEPRLFHLIETDKLSRRFVLKRHYHQGISAIRERMSLMRIDRRELELGLRGEILERRRELKTALIKLISGGLTVADLAALALCTGRVRQYRVELNRAGTRPQARDHLPVQPTVHRVGLEIDKMIGKESNEDASREDRKDGEVVLRELTKELATRLAVTEAKLIEITRTRGWRLLSTYYELMGSLRANRRASSG